MARIRTVKPEFFKHYDLFKAEKESGLPLRLSFQGLWLCADKEGRFKYSPPQLKLDILPYDDVNFDNILIELEKRQFIESYEIDGNKYGLIPTFKEHQRITGSEATAESKIPEPPRKKSRNSKETARKHQGNAQDDRKGREGKGIGKEKEGKGGDAPDIPSEFLGVVVYDAEKEILDNPIQFEKICMNTGKDPATAKEALRKYHLWLADKEHYPKGKSAVYAGFEKWLMNEKTFLNGNKSNTSGGDKRKSGTSEARTERAKTWGSSQV